MRLLQDEVLRPELISSYSEEELQSFLTQCDIPWEASQTKVMACLPTYSLQEWSFTSFSLIHISLQR